MRWIAKDSFTAETESSREEERIAPLFHFNYSLLSVFLR